MVPVEGQPRERLEARWQVMMFAAGRVAPALRGRHKISERTIDRDRQPDRLRAAVREGAAPRTNRARESRSRIAHQTRETGLTQGRLAESAF